MPPHNTAVPRDTLVMLSFAVLSAVHDFHKNQIHAADVFGHPDLNGVKLHICRAPLEPLSDAQVPS